ncbi:MAG: CDP-glycerol glycerophosphotransferase family protein [Pseudomonadota bacterium]
MKGSINMKISKLVNKSPVVILLTILFACISSLLIDIQGFYFNLTLLAATFLQVVLLTYKKVYSAIVPFEKVTKLLSEVYPSYFKNIVLLLILTPLISSVSFVLGVVWVLVAYLIVSKALLNIARRVIERRKLLNNSKEMYKEDAPQVVVYMSGLQDVAYQINQWLPVLERLSKKVVILVRERSVVEGMQSTDIPVYFARTQFEVEYALTTVGSVKTVLYPANTMKNVQALRHYELNHYFINHGESDKAVNQSKVLMAYDKLLVGGPLAERRLREVGLPLRDDQVIHVGRPQAEVLLDKKNEWDANIKTILYAPTWEGFVEDVNYSSVSELGFKAVTSLLKDEKFNIIFKPHPYTGVRSKDCKYWLSKINEFCRHHEKAKIYDKMMPIHHAMNECDLLITDISSVLNEFLITDKPIVLCNVKNSSKDELNKNFPSSQAAYILGYDNDALKLVSSVANEDALATKRKEVCQDSLSNFPEGAMKRFEDIINKSTE